MKIALAQINTTVGDFSGNLKKVLDFYQKAQKQKADLVVFPELTLTGYPPKDLLERPDFIEANLKTLKALSIRIKNTACVVGYVEKNSQASGRPVYNALALIQKGKILWTYFKQLLPNYDVFDEARYFEAGEDSGVLEWGGLKIGFSLCEDLWAKAFDGPRPLYKKDPLEQQLKQKIDLLINLSASPYCLGRSEVRQSFFSALIKKAKVPLFYTNLVGGNDDLVFDGHSFVINKKGEVCGTLAGFKEDFKIFDFERLKFLKKRSSTPTQESLEALQLGLKDYLAKTGFKKVVLGLSGGVDSALTAWVAARALGPDKVLGLIMPSKFSSLDSIQDALALAKALKIKTRQISIAGLYENFKESLQLQETKKISLSLQNLQARIRGNLLMALSNQEGRLLLTTGNKSELSLGYCTLYGDMAGGFNVLGDVPKTWVYQLAKEANRQLKAIPKSTLLKAPSAELAPHQKDQDDLPPYEIVDPILEAYLEKGLSPQEILKLGFDKKTIEQVLRRLDANEYKRMQAAPCIRITSKAFGYGRRIPLAQAYRIKL
ncbi:MAG: NAD+ synthase [Deltaproteobacteria bacterium]|nr:NAD+ synthase [Deltaproteobacteria bacterium]